MSAGRALAAALAAAVFGARLAAAQSDPRLLQAVRQAQAGEVDSARAAIRRLASATPTTDPLYPEILYSTALTTADVTERERNLQRVTVEYPLSPWADDAMLLLAQSEYASGNLPGTARDLERIRRDYAASPVLPKAAVWAARTYFDMRNQRAACEWVLAGLRRRDADTESRTQLNFQAQHCGSLIAASDTIAPLDTIAKVVTAPAVVDTAPAVAAAPPSTAVPVAPPTAAPPRDTTPVQRIDTVRASVAPAGAPAVPRAAPPPAAGGFRVQLAAAATRQEAEGIVRGLGSRGVDADIVEEKGYFKVRTGHFGSRREAQAEASRLRARLGNGAFVVGG